MSFVEAAPTLTDGVVTLRAHRPDDAPGVWEQCVDPLSRAWTTVPLDYTYADAVGFVSRVADGWREGTEWAFAVEAADDAGVPRFAGTVSLRDERVRRAEVAFGAHPWARGRGVMERALRLLLGWGFGDLGLETVVWWADRGNWASRRLAWRLGFAFEGALRSWLPQRGDLRDCWVGTLRSADERAPRTPWHDVPTLHGTQVVLRRLVPADAPRVVEGCLDPETVRWLGQIPQPYHEGLAHEFIESREEEHATGRGITWALADPLDGRLVGLANLFGIVPGTHAEVGYWVHPEVRGRGVGTEACRLAVRHAFVPTEDGGLGLGRVRAMAAVDNHASRRVLVKAGLTEQGRERRALRVGGGALADAVLLDVLAEEHRAR